MEAIFARRLSVFTKVHRYCKGKKHFIKCQTTKHVFVLRIDTNVDPCDNFYDFACGSFIEENHTPDESVAVDFFTTLKDTIDSQVLSLLTSSNDDNIEETTSLKLSREWFKTCLARDRESNGRRVASFTLHSPS